MPRQHFFTFIDVGSAETLDDDSGGSSGQAGLHAWRADSTAFDGLVPDAAISRALGQRSPVGHAR